MAILWRASLNKCEYLYKNCARLSILALGPILIALASCIISLCAFVYYRFVLPYLYFSFPESALNNVHWVAGIYFVLQLFFHYFYCVIAGPGKVTDRECVKLTGLSLAQFRDQHTREAIQEDKDGAEKLHRGSGRLEYKVCNKCCAPKPSRAHHCSICNVCVLKMDHHCPWLHNCVGNGNHRSFFLFLFWLVFADAYFLAVSYPFWYAAFVVNDSGVYNPGGSQEENSEQLLQLKTLSLLAFVLAGVLSVVLFAFMAHTAKLFLRGETSVEDAQNSEERIIAAFSGESFVNDYDLGTVRNVLVFFNICSKWDWLFLVLPYPSRPYTDGLEYPSIKDLYTANDPLSVYRAEGQAPLLPT